MRAWRRCAVIAACAMALATSSGCGSPSTRFYALTPLPPDGDRTAATAHLGPSVGVGPVQVPERLNRPEIVTWVNDSMLHLADFDQWAAPLRDSVPRILAENLSLLIPTNRVTIYPWFSQDEIDYEVRVEVSRFEGSLGKDCALVARWSVVRRLDKRTKAGASRHTEPAGDSYATLVAAQSRLIAALSRDIAAALGSVSR